MMLTDPGGVQAYLLGIDRLIEDVGNQIVGGAPVVFIVVVAQGKITELHGGLTYQSQ
jgi:hypothetical protein